MHLLPLPATLGLLLARGSRTAQYLLGLNVLKYSVCKMAILLGIYFHFCHEEVCLLSPQCSPLVSRLW